HMPLGGVRMAAVACAVLAVGPGNALTPRPGWSLAPGAEDLIANGFWNCRPGVSVAAGQLTINAANQYNTVINTTDPSLEVQGDFSVLATISAPAATGAFITLVGSLNQGAWWNGLKRLDVGIAGNIQAAAWTGTSPDPTNHTFPPSTVSDPLDLEVARIG